MLQARKSGLHSCPHRVSRRERFLTQVHRIAIIVAQHFQFTTCKPRTPNSLGLFSSYDGNIIGGALLGLGMALTGACPGTVVPQVVAGVRSGPLVLAGGLLGGIVYSRFGKKLQQKVINPPPVTAYEGLGLSRTTGIIAYEALLIAAVVLFNKLSPDSRTLLLPSFLGGTLIGVSQFTSLYLTGNTLGISGAFEQLGDVFWHLISLIAHPNSTKSSFPRYQNTTAFAIGAAIGSLVVGRAFNIATIESVDISNARAVFGGAVMVVGARIAGGCTSGHGISGMSQLSVSSIISVVSMFGAGILGSALLIV